MATQKTDTQVKNNIVNIQKNPPLLHLGKVKNKHAKRLKRNQGKLMLDVNHAIGQVQGTVDGNVHPLVISYEEKPRKKKKLKNKLNLMGLKINRKKLKRRMKKNGIRLPKF